MVTHNNIVDNQLNNSNKNNSGVLQGYNKTEVSSQFKGNTAGSNNNSMTVVGVFESKNSAEQAIRQLRQQGFIDEEINIVSKQENVADRETHDDDITDGAITGGTIGGLGGLLVGTGVVASIGAMAIPGIGPVIASGPIAAAIGGALAGGIAGGLIDWGIPAESSRKYEQKIAGGDILALIRTSSTKVDTAAQVLRQYGAKDVESHSTPKSRE